MAFIIDYFIHLYLKYTHKRIDYDKYRTTKHWARMKRKALKRADYRCQFCGTRKGVLIPHHNSYENLYFEKKSEIVVLCLCCHNTMHFYRWKPKKDRKAS